MALNLGCYLTSLGSGQHAHGGGHLWPSRAEQAGCTVTPVWYDVESAHLGLAQRQWRPQHVSVIQP